jgi:hypothetical protein
MAMRLSGSRTFGDGIISAVNFKLDIKKVEDPEGGLRAVITLDGKFLPFQPFKSSAAYGPGQRVAMNNWPATVTDMAFVKSRSSR